MNSVEEQADINSRRIVVGITGGIAAYKAAELVRLLVKAEWQVRVVMTKAAQAFITPMTLQALSGNPVHTELLNSEAEGAMGHIELAKWAQILVVAPASADFMARLNVGMANDLLSTVCLATKAKIVLAPAMNQGMWSNVATQKNYADLVVKGFAMLGPESGEQACGDIGLGRMMEAANIVAGLLKTDSPGCLKSKNIVITAGPTQEALDPVRFISNHSSGKMGYSLAAAAVQEGASVVLISGPTALAAPKGVRLVKVKSAEEMLRASEDHGQNADIFIAAAAVADYRADKISEQKIKKNQGETMTLLLRKNPDIVASMAADFKHLFTVGFAAETHNVLEFAREKRVSKKLDMIIANDVSNEEIGFNSDENAVTVISRRGEEHLGQMPKPELAKLLVIKIAEVNSLNA